MSTTLKKKLYPKTTINSPNNILNIVTLILVTIAYAGDASVDDSPLKNIPLRPKVTLNIKCHTSAFHW